MVKKRKKAKGKPPLRTIDRFLAAGGQVYDPRAKSLTGDLKADVEGLLVKSRRDKPSTDPDVLAYRVWRDNRERADFIFGLAKDDPTLSRNKLNARARAKFGKGLRNTEVDKLRRLADAEPLIVSHKGQEYEIPLSQVTATETGKTGFVSVRQAYKPRPMYCSVVFTSPTTSDPTKTVSYYRTVGLDTMTFTQFKIRLLNGNIARYVARFVKAKYNRKPNEYKITAYFAGRTNQERHMAEMRGLKKHPKKHHG